MSENWSSVGERGGLWGLYLVVGVYKALGRTVCRIVLAPVVTYFYLTGGSQRRASRDYLKRAFEAGRLGKRPGFFDGLRHFLTFSDALLDKLAAWTGRIRPRDIDGVHDGLFDAAKKAGRGAVVLTAHLGNPEVIRAVATVSGRFRVNVLVHTAHAENFNRVIERFSPDAPVRLVQVSQIDVGVAMRLSAAVERGEWVVMTGDRSAVRDPEGSSVEVDFLGAPARFPTGPYVLAAALKCPTYTMFCLKRGKRYAVEFELFADPVLLPRTRRAEALRAHAAIFAGRLEKMVARAPFQWFNFYDYWGAERVTTSKAAFKRKVEA
ncbi:MAG: lipid A biosynthesis acyltransferase [Alphaproteobacteria bacterium]|nr:lipid A biosynthesis acyltransferase [Alphaproteobacteria bacterium]